MILFILLSVIVILLLAFIIAVAGTFGATFVIIFGDVIVCIAIIVCIMKKIINKKK